MSWWPHVGADSVVDPLEDTTEEHIWRWELRDAKVLPKSLRGPAQGIKKALHEARSLHTSAYNAQSAFFTDHHANVQHRNRSEQPLASMRTGLPV